MHSWASHLVSQAQQQIYASSVYHNSTPYLDDHRDHDLPPSSDAIPLLIPPSPTRPRGNRPARFLPPSDDEEGGPPPNQSFSSGTSTSNGVCPTPSSPFSSPPAPPQLRPFASDASLHASIRHAVFRYGSSLTPASYPPFFALAPDSATTAFLTACTDAFYHSSRCSCYHLTHLLLKPLVSLCLSHTAVNGLLDTGHMFLLSSQQFLALWSFHVLGSSPSTPPPSPSSSTSSFGALLDVGAGSGHITAAIAPFFSSTTATEVSWMMTRRLSRRGYSTFHTHSLATLPPSLTFDCVLCFNVLDRCSHPRSLLQQLRSRLRSPSSLLLLATPLPLDPWVEVGKQWRLPEESLGLEVSGEGKRCTGCMGWEETVERLTVLFIEQGFAVRSVSRLPYISAGNAVKPFFTLDDALFALARTEVETID